MRLQLRVKELEWELSALQPDVDLKQTNGTATSSASVEELRNKVFDVIKVLSTGKCYFLIMLFL